MITDPRQQTNRPSTAVLDLPSSPFGAPANPLRVALAWLTATTNRNLFVKCLAGGLFIILTQLLATALLVQLVPPAWATLLAGLVFLVLVPATLAVVARPLPATARWLSALRRAIGDETTSELLVALADGPDWAVTKDRVRDVLSDLYRTRRNARRAVYAAARNAKRGVPDRAQLKGLLAGEG